MEIKEKPITFHRHFCFLCRRSYEEVETGECQYGHDHPWGKCPPCEDKFAIDNQSLSYDGPHVGFNLNLMIVNLFKQRQACWLCSY